MKPEPLQNSQQLEQDYQATLAALREEKNQQISEYQAQAWKMAQRANEEEQRAEYLKAEIERINANAEQDRDERDAYRGERDALQARIDGALMPLKSVAGVARHWAKYSGSADKSDLGCVVVKAIEILTGEGE